MLLKYLSIGRPYGEASEIFGWVCMCDEGTGTIKRKLYCMRRKFLVDNVIGRSIVV